MPKPKASPGPWTQDEQNCCIIRDANGGWVTTLPDLTLETDGDLITAAPELLTELAWLFELLGRIDEEIPCGWMDQEERLRLDSLRDLIEGLQAVRGEGGDAG